MRNKYCESLDFSFSDGSISHTMENFKCVCCFYTLLIYSIIQSSVLYFYVEWPSSTFMLIIDKEFWITLLKFVIAEACSLRIPLCKMSQKCSNEFFLLGYPTVYEIWIPLFQNNNIFSIEFWNIKRLILDWNSGIEVCKYSDRGRHLLTLINYLRFLESDLRDINGVVIQRNNCFAYEENSLIG